AGDQEIVDALRHQHAIRQLVIAARLGDWRKLENDVARDMRLDRPAVDADGILERRTAEHVLARELIATHDTARLADAELRWQVDDVGILETRHRAQELKGLDGLPAPIDLAAREIVGFEPVDGGTIAAFQLREVHAPFDLRALRPHDRAL